MSLATVSGKTDDTQTNSNDTVTVSGFPVYAQYQILDHWCWDAVGSANASFFLPKTVGNSAYQCNNASTYLKTSGCCDLTISYQGQSKAIAGWIPLIFWPGNGPVQASSSSPCNKGGWPQWILNGTGKLTSTMSSNYYTSSSKVPTYPDSAQVQKIVDALTNNQPVIMNIQWGTPAKITGGHVVTIYSTYTIKVFSSTIRAYDVADPWDGFHSGVVAPGVGGQYNGGFWGNTVYTVPKTAS